MASAVFPYKLLAALVVVTFSALPISRLFQWWNPPPVAIMLGGYSALISLPVLIKLVMYDEKQTTPLTKLSMFLTPFMFASAIDLIVSLENDGIIVNYMAFYLQRGEMYLSSPWSTAVCYWDGIIHFAAYWFMLYYFHTGDPRFRSVVFHWFGTFWISVVILVLGSIMGPFEVRVPILLNLPYLILPLILLIVCAKTTSGSHGKSEGGRISVDPSGVLVRSVFILFFSLTAAVCLIRALIVLGANRELLNMYHTLIEQPLLHEHAYPKITMLIYLFYGVPYCCYAVWCLIINHWTPLFIDLSLLFAGMAANCQVGYVGPYLVPSATDKLEFSNDAYWYVFWITNAALFIVPQVFAACCYYFVSCVRVTSKSNSGDQRRISGEGESARHSYNTRFNKKTR